MYVVYTAVYWNTVYILQKKLLNTGVTSRLSLADFSVIVDKLFTSNESSQLVLPPNAWETSTSDWLTGWLRHCQMSTTTYLQCLNQPVRQTLVDVFCCRQVTVAQSANESFVRLCVWTSPRKSVSVNHTVTHSLFCGRRNTSTCDWLTDWLRHCQVWTTKHINERLTSWLIKTLSRGDDERRQRANDWQSLKCTRRHTITCEWVTGWRTHCQVSTTKHINWLAD